MVLSPKWICLRPNINETFVELYKSNRTESYSNESLKVLEIPSDTLTTEDFQCSQSKVYLIYSEDYVKEHASLSLEETTI